MILDSHIHTHMELFKGSVKENQRDLLDKMHQAGVDGGALLSLEPTVYPDIPYKDRIDNVLELCAGQELLFPFFFLYPPDEDTEEQMEYAAKNGICGFKIICTSFYPGDPRCIAACKKAAEMGKPVTFHSGILWDGGGVSGKYNRPTEFESLLDVKNLRFALAHMSWPWCEENIAVYGKFENTKYERGGEGCEMFIDTVPGTPRNRREAALDIVCCGDYEVKYNIMFGTDCRTDSYNVQWTKEWIERDKQLFNKFGIDSEDFLEHYYCKNFLRFIGKSDEKVKKADVAVADTTM